MTRPPRDVGLLAGVFAVVGTLHFVVPRQFEAIVPKPLPAKRELVLASGVAEVAVAGLLVAPRTRRAGGRLALGLLAAVWPANLQMTIDAARTGKPWWFTLGTVARLPLQVPMMAVARRAARGDVGR